MDQAELPPSRLQYFRSISTPPYNLSSILSIIPGSHLLNRLKAGSILNLSSNMATAAEEAEEAWPAAAAEAPRLVAAAETAAQIPAAFPSPWGFLTSGYIVGLMITAILLHRIQNVVIPSPRRPTRHGYPWPRRTTTTTTLWDRLRAAILPLDFSRTTTRLVIHLPSVYLLSRMLVVWTVLTLQTCQVPVTVVVVHGGTGPVLGYWETWARWAVGREMAEICWSTFCAVCGAFLIEGFIKAMDGLGGGGLPLGGGVNSLSPFHLISYAFLLHVYSSPAAHGFHPVDDSPSRPDKHVVITITIALLQLSMFHVFSISKRLSTHRLIPTAVASMLSLVHFHTTIFFHFVDVPTTTTPTTTTTTTMAQPSPNRYVGVGATYPLLNYVPNLLETVLLGTILLTVTVNAVAQLLVRGRIDHVLSGLGIFSGLPDDDGMPSGFFANLPYEEDFIIVLMRIGVASLEATGLRGWNNEVAPIRRPRMTPRRVSSRRRKWEFGHSVEEEEETYGEVRMGRLGVAQVRYGSSCVARTSGAVYGMKKNRGTAEGWRARLQHGSNNAARVRRGFNNDVRIIDLGSSGGGSGLFGGPWNRSVVGFWQFLVVLGGVIRGLVALLVDRARRRVGRGERKSRQAVVEEERDDEGEDEDEDEGEESTKEVYQRFLRGEDISDDDEEEEAVMEGSLSVSDEEMSDDGSDEGFREREGEVVDLFADLLRSRPEEGEGEEGEGQERRRRSSGEMALAHLLHDGSTARRRLTRRVWKGLWRRGYLESDDDDGGGDDDRREGRYWSGVERERDGEKGLEHVCVVCMLETREIICWPCRCLAMCDGCRGRLAMRASASKHRCPCCRQIVDGYSKIYIP